MSTRSLVVLCFVLGACSAPPSPESDAATLTPAHAAAMRDSVQAFLAAYATDVSAPPVGKRAREAMGAFMAPEIVMSMDLAPDTPVLVQTLDSLIPADEVVSVPPWIRSTRFAWDKVVVTPLAPGLATYAGTYAEHVTDSTGATTSLPGVQQGVVRNGAGGWRFVAMQSSHPMVTHTRQGELMARFAPAP